MWNFVSTNTIWNYFYKLKTNGQVFEIACWISNMKMLSTRFTSMLFANEKHEGGNWLNHNHFFHQHEIDNLIWCLNLQMIRLYKSVQHKSYPETLLRQSFRSIDWNPDTRQVLVLSRHTFSVKHETCKWLSPLQADILNCLIAEVTTNSSNGTAPTRHFFRGHRSLWLSAS